MFNNWVSGVLDFLFLHMTVEGVRHVGGSVAIMQTPAVFLWSRCEFKLLNCQSYATIQGFSLISALQSAYINYVVLCSYCCVGFNVGSSILESSL